MSCCGEDTGRRLRSHARGAMAIVFPHEVDAGYRTTQFVITDRPTVDRPRRAAACKGLCVRDGGPAANFFGRCVTADKYFTGRSEITQSPEELDPLPG